MTPSQYPAAATSWKHAGMMYRHSITSSQLHLQCLASILFLNLFYTHFYSRQSNANGYKWITCYSWKKIKRKGEKKSEALGLFEWKSLAHFFLSVCSSSEWIWEIKDVKIIIIIKSTIDIFFNHISRRQFFYGRTEKTVWNWSLSASWRTRVPAVMNWYCVSVADFFLATDKESKL